MNQAIDISLIIELCEAFYFHSEVCQICNLGMQQTTSLSANSNTSGGPQKVTMELNYLYKKHIEVSTHSSIRFGSF